MRAVKLAFSVLFVLLLTAQDPGVGCVEVVRGDSVVLHKEGYAWRVEAGSLELLRASGCTYSEAGTYVLRPGDSVLPCSEDE